MNDENNIEDLLAGLEPEPSPPTSNISSPPLKPGDTDAIPIRLDEDEIARLACADSDDLSKVLLAILSAHTGDFECLCHHFIVPSTQYTLDDGSLEIEDYEIDDIDSGFAHCEFTASMYAGCRDVNDDCDPRDCVLDVAVNLSGRTITVSTTVPDNDRDPEEF